MGWEHVNALQDCVQPPKKERVENHVSGEELETLQKSTYVQIVTGNRIGKTDSIKWSNLYQNNKKDSEGLLKLYGSFNNNIRLLKAY